MVDSEKAYKSTEPQSIPQISDLQIRLAVAIEHLRHLTDKVDERYETIKRLHQRMDEMKNEASENKIRISHLEKFVYASLAFSVSTLLSILVSLLQKFYN